jgi:glycosyltransferase involved in cell wall biosynthesis
MRELTEIRHAHCKELFAESDRIVAVAEWVKELLLHNNVPPEKITLSRQGTAAAAAKPASRGEDKAFRIAWLGRFDPTKGLETLVKALRQERELKLRLDLYGITQGASDETYRSKIQAAAAADPRIRLLPPIPAREVPEKLAAYDLLAVPSEWLETGPLVVLEAFAAGVPVLGSKLGGIAELVRDGVNGLLAAPGSVADWRRQLRRLATEPGLLAKLRSGVRPPRTMEEVAQEMERLYASLA